MTMDLCKYAGSFVDNYLSSCSDISRKISSYASGNCIVRSSTGVLRSVYCDASRTFGGNSTGWMRVAELDVNNCPPGLRITSSVNACVVTEDNAGCTGLIILLTIRGYHVITFDGFFSHNTSIRPRPSSFTNANNNY